MAWRQERRVGPVGEHPGAEARRHLVIEQGNLRQAAAQHDGVRVEQIDDVRQANVDLTIEGPEGYRLEGTNDMGQISRDPLDLVRQTLSEHQYPDGFVLFCGTLFAPTQDRDEPGAGFTHKLGDRVTIGSRRLGTLVNTVTTSRDAPPWEMGLAAFVRTLAGRGLIDRI